MEQHIGYEKCQFVNGTRVGPYEVYRSDGTLEEKCELASEDDF